ncbi:MAG: murein biosynthesis integral membrane protein MurJ [Candidatus Omnitrophota bacterium]
MSRKKIIKNVVSSSAGTFISRFLGFTRDILIAGFFGTTPVLEAFLVAFRLPNLFRSILGEGFTDSIAIPILAEHRKERIFSIANSLLSLFLAALSIVSLFGIILSKYLVILIAPGFASQPDKLSMTVSFTRIIFIYLLFIGISVNIKAVLFSLKKFFIPSLTPAFLNISFIIGVLFFSRFFENYILAICVVSGGVLQVIFPYIFLKKEGFILRLNFKNLLGDKDIIRMLKLFPPRIFSSVVYHLSVFLDTILCSFTLIAGSGAIAAIHYANRLIQLPLALITIPLCQVAIIDLSSYHKQGNMEEFKKLFVFSFQNIVFFTLPIVAVFLFIPQGIIDVIYRRAAFGEDSLNITSMVLFFYALGLFFFCLIKVMLNAFYALKDTLIPAKTTAACLLINGILSVILMFPFKAGGVALGSSLAAGCNAALLYYFLIKKIGKINWEDTGQQFIRVVFLSLIAGVISRFVWQAIPLSKYLKILIVGAEILVVLGLGGSILGLKQVRYFKQKFIGMRK